MSYGKFLSIAQGLLIAALLAVGERGWLGPVLWIGMSVVLLLKMRLEEHYWCQRSPAYVEYMKKTKELIPFVF